MREKPTEKTTQEVLAALEWAVQQLRDSGWKQEDFARALRELLETDKPPITLTKDEAKNHTHFDHTCTCGGHNWRRNGHPEENPHMPWCPQKPQYDAWYSAMHQADTK